MSMQPHMQKTTVVQYHQLRLADMVSSDISVLKAGGVCNVLLIAVQQEIDLWSYRRRVDRGRKNIG